MRPIRLVVYRPHNNIWFKTPVRDLLAGRSLPNKYGPLFDFLLRSGIQLDFSTALCREPGIKGAIRWVIEPAELLLWCMLHRLPLRSVGFVWTRSALRRRDVLFMMHYGTLSHEQESAALKGRLPACRLADVNIVKVVHLTHFAYRPVIGADNLKELRPTVLVAENDLGRNSRFFARYFAAIPAESWRLPYVASHRFVCRMPFERRVNKLVATGSITYKIQDPAFVSFYGGNELQPLRRMLYEQAEFYADEVDSLISDLNASREEAQTQPKPSLLSRISRRLSSALHPQNNYYRRDIVEVYNSYTMFAVPEEICDLPAIGFAEGMACGCAYLGLDDPMYGDLGMAPNVHYIAHDGTVEGLIATVRFWQQPQQRQALERIAAAGQAWVERTLRPEVVYQAFVDRLATRFVNTPLNARKH